MGRVDHRGDRDGPGPQREQREPLAALCHRSAPPTRLPTEIQAHVLPALSQARTLMLTCFAKRSHG